ncbi:MAG: peptide MFS transporter, partial [Deltaproteobacteria bacterium]|nr:peptide MFS transporter [Deltaproteobacteria bacterium]
VYAFGVVGGLMAQRLIGPLRAIVVGGVLMALGHLVMALPWGGGLYWALALLCVGNGLFKPNVSSSVGALYEEGDRRKAQAYYLFYMGINFGAMLAPVICGAVADRFGWHFGFGLAGVGMLLGLIVLVRGRRLIRPRADVSTLDGPLSLAVAVGSSLAVIAMIPLCTLLLVVPVLGHLSIGVVSLGVVAAMVVMALRLPPAGRDRLFALLVLMAFHTAFWAAFEQVGSSFTVLANDHVDRGLMGMEIPAPALLAINGLFIITLAPVVSWLWGRLARRGLEPSTPAKFGLGLVLLGLGFLVFAFGIERGQGPGGVALAWMVLCYVLLSVGELCLSPVGLAMVTELSPRRAVSFCMGAWFMTYANGHLLAGWIASTTTGDVGPSLERYAEVFERVGLVATGLGIALAMVRRWLSAMIEGDPA